MINMIHRIATVFLLITAVFFSNAQTPSLILSNTDIKICYGENEAMLYFSDVENGADMYKIESSEPGFQMDEFESLPESVIVIPIPAETQAGVVDACLHVYNSTDDTENRYDFAITILPPFSAGAILLGYETVSIGGRANVIGSITGASGGDDDITYRWKSNGIIIENAGEATYMPPASETGTFIYTREAKDATCSDWEVSVGSWELTVLSFFDAGKITSGQEIVCLNGAASEIMNETGAAGGSGIVEYRWKSNGVIVGDAVSATYMPAATEQGTFIYTREARDAQNGEWIVSLGSWSLTVIAALDAPSQPLGDSRLCQSVQGSNYSVEPVPSATAYSWEISNSDAGTIEGNGSEVYIIWNPNFSGQVNIRAKATGACGESSFGPALEIIVNKIPAVRFTEGEIIVCANQKNILYEVTLLADAGYEWTVENGKILEQNNNKIYVHWDNSSGSTGTVTVKVIDRATQCEFSEHYPVLIAGSSVPNLNAIVAKTNANGEPYMLIYPNPTGQFVYQWYQDDKKINGATEQFYYPPNFGSTLSHNAEYKVYVADAGNTSCGNFTTTYKISNAEMAKKSTNPFLLYPNPATDYFTLSFDNELKEKYREANLEISTFGGMKIMEERIDITGNYMCNKKLRADTYLLTITVDGKKYTQILIVQ